MQIGLLQGVNAARVGESWRCESLAGATGVFGVKYVSCSMFLKSLTSLIFVIVCVVSPPPPQLFLSVSRLVYIHKSDFLSEICSVSFKNK